MNFPPLLYQEDDKIMLLETGEVFTVRADLAYVDEPAIGVKENLGRLLLRTEVRPAGHTRQRYELACSITPPDSPAPPPPDDCMRLAHPATFSQELHRARGSK